MISLADNLIALVTALMTRTAQLFEFTIPEIPATWYYTSWPRTITFGGHDYVPAPLKLSNRGGGAGQIERNPFTVSGAYVEPFVSFSGRMYGVRVKCVVRDLYWDGDQWLGYTVATGVRMKTKRGDYDISVDFQPFAGAINKNVPGILYQRLDARMPYWKGFTASADSVKQMGCTVLSLASTVLISASASKKAGGVTLDPVARPIEADWYKGGYIEYTRNITGIDGRTVTVTFRDTIVNNTPDFAHPENSFFKLRFPPPLLSEVTGENSFSAVPGYDQSPTHAATKFDNFEPDFTDDESEGYLGFPHLAIVNYAITPVQRQ